MRKLLERVARGRIQIYLAMVWHQTLILCETLSFIRIWDMFWSYVIFISFRECESHEEEIKKSKKFPYRVSLQYFFNIVFISLSCRCQFDWEEHFIFYIIQYMLNTIRWTLHTVVEMFKMLVQETHLNGKRKSRRFEDWKSGVGLRKIWTRRHAVGLRFYGVYINFLSLLRYIFFVMDGKKVSVDIFISGLVKKVKGRFQGVRTIKRKQLRLVKTSAIY